MQCANGASAEWGVSDDNCTSKCGDGFRSLLEMCDDGNLDDDDGCSATCEYEEANGISGLWECQARAATRDLGTSDDEEGSEFNENVSLPVINTTELLRTYPSTEAAAAVAQDMCRRDVCRLVEGLSIAGAEQTAQVVTTGDGVLAPSI